MELKKILRDTNFEFKKKFGQNFISDGNLLQAICDDAELTEQDEVLEIGVGAGTLTKAIATNAKKVVGYEIDNTLKDVLLISLQDINNVEIVFEDFLKAEECQIAKKFSRKFKVVANLPYYVTTDIIFKLIQGNFDISSITIMVQKEVAERLVAKCGTKDYGSITVQLESCSDVKITRIVDRMMFNPVPNVDSAIVNIKINRNKFDIKNQQLHTRVIKAGFSMRRKTLANCLKSNFCLTTTQIDSLFHKLGYLSTIRGEMLSAKEYVNLSNALSEILV